VVCGLSSDDAGDWRNVDDMSAIDDLIHSIAAGYRPSRDDALRLADVPAETLMPAAADLAREGHGRVVTYSRKVFIPVTRLCRDVCSYCTFATVPSRLEDPYLTLSQTLAIAEAGAAAGCREALFTLGDQPEARYRSARLALQKQGYARTLDLLHDLAREVLSSTGLLPHLNPGLMAFEDFRRLRSVAVSMGLMLESSADRLCEPGGPHFGSPDKLPSRRLAAIAAAGQASVPLTTGILIGIGETRRERIESLLAIRELHDRHGHIQDLIVQNFQSKPGTRMATAPDAPLVEQLWTNAVARILFGPEMSIQAPPNLRADDLAALLESGINDWGGVSPVTPDYVNPEAPWPMISVLASATAATGRVLVERLAITPRFALAPGRWADAALLPQLLRLVDATGHSREVDWHAGSGAPLPVTARGWVSAKSAPELSSPEVRRVLAAARQSHGLDVRQIETLFAARGPDLRAVISEADRVRRDLVGDEAGYVVNRNINYTNICGYRCGFCAFSKGRSTTSLRGPAYRLDVGEIVRRAVEAQRLGATEVCLQGGIHPSYTGDTYLEILEALRRAAPALHIHAFSPLEVIHGARTLGLDLRDYLQRLRAAGLSTLPGTAAEILVDEVRAVICPDKLTAQQWMEVARTAHQVGLPSTATIMFGHVDSPTHWALHLLALRELQQETGGFTEFVPLPFVHMEAPIWRRGFARSGPTFREAVLMHSIARLVLAPQVRHIQASWVKMGLDGMAFCLQAGADDMGGTLIDESITRAAGGTHGQCADTVDFCQIAESIGRTAWQRTTLYRPVTAASAPCPVKGRAGPGRPNLARPSATR
jgi:FO synthase